MRKTRHHFRVPNDDQCVSIQPRAIQAEQPDDIQLWQVEAGGYGVWIIVSQIFDVFSTVNHFECTVDPIILAADTVNGRSDQAARATARSTAEGTTIEAAG
jgi:hypothetical protein